MEIIIKNGRDEFYISDSFKIVSSNINGNNCLYLKFLNSQTYILLFDYSYMFIDETLNNTVFNTDWFNEFDDIMSYKVELEISRDFKNMLIDNFIFEIKQQIKYSMVTQNKVINIKKIYKQEKKKLLNNFMVNGREIYLYNSPYTPCYLKDKLL